jgi:formate dehydrogenase accessory protein FdhD
MVKVNIHGTPIATDRKIPIKLAGEGASGPKPPSEWFIPEEVPVAFVYNRRNYAVMMATPDDLVDFAVGFSLTERVIETASDIISLDINHSDKGVDFRFKIPSDQLEKLDLTQRRRNMVGSASCGLCGLENADTLFEKLPIVAPEPVTIEALVLERAMNALAAHQPINKRTHSVHAAAWVDMDGQIIALREDVGRHNALDKLLGALAQNETDMQAGFVVMSSRCSYELVEKAAQRGVIALMTISGPTGFALQKAKEANMAIYSRSPSGPVQLIF